MTADACLKHPWIKSIPDGKERNLKKNKKNLKKNKKNNNYYLFDSSNKTMSVASTHEDGNWDEGEWEWEDEDLVSLILLQTLNFSVPMIVTVYVLPLRIKFKNVKTETPQYDIGRTRSGC